MGGPTSARLFAKLYLRALAVLNAQCAEGVIQPQDIWVLMRLVERMHFRPNYLRVKQSRIGHKKSARSTTSRSVGRLMRRGHLGLGHGQPLRYIPNPHLVFQGTPSKEKNARADWPKQRGMARRRLKKRAAKSSPPREVRGFSPEELRQFVEKLQRPEEKCPSEAPERYPWVMLNMSGVASLNDKRRRRGKGDKEAKLSLAAYQMFWQLVERVFAGDAERLKRGRIAADTGIAMSNVTRAINELVEAGFVVKKKEGRTVRYLISPRVVERGNEEERGAALAEWEVLRAAA